MNLRLAAGEEEEVRKECAPKSAEAAAAAAAALERQQQPGANGDTRKGENCEEATEKSGDKSE
jgi:hypothetical protein